MPLIGQMDVAEVAQAAQAIVSTLALLAVIYQMYYLRRGIRGVTQDNIYAHYSEVCKVFLEKPYLRPYFYDRKVYAGLDPDHPDLREEIDATSELILGVIEHAVVQRENLLESAWHSCWGLYAFERVRHSLEIRSFFDGHEEYYTLPMRGVIRALKQRFPERAVAGGDVSPVQAAVG